MSNVLTYTKITAVMGNNSWMSTIAALVITNVTANIVSPVKNIIVEYFIAYLKSNFLNEHRTFSPVAGRTNTASLCTCNISALNQNPEEYRMLTHFPSFCRRMRCFSISLFASLSFLFVAIRGLAGTPFRAFAAQDLEQYMVFVSESFPKGFPHTRHVLFCLHAEHIVIFPRCTGVWQIVHDGFMFIGSLVI